MGYPHDQFALKFEFDNFFLAAYMKVCITLLILFGAIAILVLCYSNFFEGGDPYKLALEDLQKKADERA
jgi:hypothetical protein